MADNRGGGGNGAREPGQPVEIELKLGLTAEAADALLASPLLRENAQGPVRTRDMRGVYYDTPDRRLRARGASLRVREVDGRYVQTLKSAKRPDVPLAQRGEWEVELDGPAPRPAAFDDPAAHELTGLLLSEELGPVFELRVRRRVALVEWPPAGGNGRGDADGDADAARVELAFDDGRATVADGRSLPVSEVELELVRGGAEALFGLAEAMRGVAPLRLEPLDKATRGWMLATGSPPAASKAAPVPLARGQTVDEALVAALGATLRHWLDNEPAAADGGRPEGLHQLRVALRRLRSALTLFADALGEPARGRWDDELRWLLGHLGAPRDLDVLATGLLPPLLEARGEDDPTLRALRDAIAARRAAAQADLRETLASQRYADLALSLAAWVERRGWRGEAADPDARRRQEGEVAAFAAGVLRRRHKRVAKRGRGFERLDPEARHRLRIALKKLRYGMDFFAGLFPGKRLDRFRKATARMQDRLGHLNDVAVASRLVRELVDPLPPGPEATAAALGGGQLVGWYAHQVAALEPETVHAWRAFRRLDPFWGDE